eukprot:1751882-Amphidinium_carterae.1
MQNFAPHGRHFWTEVMNRSLTDQSKDFAERFARIEKRLGLMDAKQKLGYDRQKGAAEFRALLTTAWRAYRGHRAACKDPAMLVWEDIFSLPSSPREAIETAMRARRAGTALVLLKAGGGRIHDGNMSFPETAAARSRAGKRVRKTREKQALALRGGAAPSQDYEIWVYCPCGESHFARGGAADHACCAAQALADALEGYKTDASAAEAWIGPITHAALANAGVAMRENARAGIRYLQACNLVSEWPPCGIDPRQNHDFVWLSPTQAAARTQQDATWFNQIVRSPIQPPEVHGAEARICALVSTLLTGERHRWTSIGEIQQVSPVPLTVHVMPNGPCVTAPNAKHEIVLHTVEGS